MSDRAISVRRGPGRPGYDQETILRRAVELFNRQGYEATSVNDLATELGLSKSAIYHHVESKEQLLRAALDEALDGLETVIRKAHASRDVSSAEARLRAAIHDSVRVLTAHLPAVTLLLRVRGNSPAELDALARRRAIDDALTTLVRETMDEGSVRTDLPPDIVSRLLFGMVNSLVEWYRPDGRVGAERVAEVLTHLAFDGLALSRGSA